jgi:DNA polymerase III subunit epsilon
VYAIVDIETTGGFAAKHGITEIAVILHDGENEVDRFETLVNPGHLIPRYITALTGITNELVEDAPAFEAVAARIYELLSGCIFVAHNVNFDYSFVKSQLAFCGYTLVVKKLCTVRMARKIFPSLPSYSLGNLCRSLAIGIENRHRAAGDAVATTRLFEKLLAADTQKVMANMLKAKTGEQYLPLQVDANLLKDIPERPGVYYFENSRKEVIYVGKAINLIKRVKSHFSNNDSSKRKQELIRQVAHIRFKVCAGELMALILESQEIRRLWPVFNRSQKKHHHKFGVYTYEDYQGKLQLAIDKKKANLPAIYTCNGLPEGQAFIKRITGKCSNLALPDADYNTRLQSIIDEQQQELPSFALVEKNPTDDQFAVYLMERGQFYGMGYVHEPLNLPLQLQRWKQKIEASPDNDYIRALLYQFANKQYHARIDLQQ